MLRIENLLLRGDGQVAQGRMLEETSLVQSAGPTANGAGGGAGGGPPGGAGAGAPPGPPNGVHHESALGDYFETCLVSIFCGFLLGCSFYQRGILARRIFSRLKSHCKSFEFFVRCGRPYLVTSCISGTLAPRTFCGQSSTYKGEYVLSLCFRPQDFSLTKPTRPTPTIYVGTPR